MADAAETLPGNRHDAPDGSLGADDMNAMAVFAGNMQDAFVEGGEFQAVVNRHAEQVSICYLIVAVQTPEKRSC